MAGQLAVIVAVLVSLVWAGFLWLPGLLPWVNWPSFWAGVASAIVTAAALGLGGFVFFWRYRHG